MIHVYASVDTVSIEPNSVLPDLNISIFAQVKVVERMIGSLDREAPARARDAFDGSQVTCAARSPCSASDCGAASDATGTRQQK